jgi:hypothetical protein
MENDRKPSLKETEKPGDRKSSLKETEKPGDRKPSLKDSEKPGDRKLSSAAEVIAKINTDQAHSSFF